VKQSAFLKLRHTRNLRISQTKKVVNRHAGVIIKILHALQINLGSVRTTKVTLSVASLRKENVPPRKQLLDN